jgi:UDP-glucose-4-epimerase GalE
MTVLVTGGAGYIGSHMVQALVARGARVVVIDDLSSGHREALPPNVPLLEANVRDALCVMPFLRAHEVKEVLHFASRIQVGESVVDPARYYEDNLAAAIMFASAAMNCGVERFVLSSTAAVYGMPRATPIPEDHPTRPINPYGETKLAIERMLATYGRAYGLRWAALRYFNAAGCAPDGSLGERHLPETHLIPLVLDAARHGTPVSVFGRDYPTRDGTCVRDYVHVVDLVEAHLATLEHLRTGADGGVFNLGTGNGFSVQEVIDTCRRVSRREIAVIDGPRRDGDPPELVAGVTRAHDVLGWRASRSDLETIVRDAWRWQARAPSTHYVEIA